jgi:serine/threonine protein kinase/Tol biopolymer transport system component
MLGSLRDAADASQDATTVKGSSRLANALADRYRIERELGAGGMATVFLAHDVRHDRKVALKVLRPELAAVIGAERFLDEIRTTANLQHPHILPLFDSGQVTGGPLEEGEASGIVFYVMPYVEGESLRNRLTHEKQLPIEDAVQIAREVASALDYAHRHGVIHRDIKPENILLHEGQALVTDFGIALAASRSGGANRLTEAGISLGTPLYMSPEQATGERELSAPSDIYALGCVLYEMLMGEPPFTGPTSRAIVARVMTEEPRSLRLQRKTVPAHVEAAVQRALEKLPADRFQTAAQFSDALAGAGSSAVVERPTGDRAVTGRAGRGIPAWPSAIPWALSAVLLLVLAWMSLRSGQRSRSPNQNVQIHRLTDAVGLEESPALSPDGKTVAFVADVGGKRQIWIRLLAGGTPLTITKDDVDHYGPRWSPDAGSLIYYTPGTQPGEAGTIWEISGLGGNPRRLVSSLGPGDLSHDAKSLAFLRFRNGSMELAVAARDLSTTRTVAKLSPLPSYNLRWSPDDRHIAFLQDGSGAAFYSVLMITDVASGELRRAFAGFILRGFGWAPDGSALIVSSAQGSTMSYPPTFNLWSIPVNGDPPRQLTFGEASYEFPDVGARGILVASRVISRSDVWRIPVTGDPVENALQGVRVTRQTGQIQTLTVSPDNSEVAFLSDNGGHANVWIARMANGEMRPLTRESDPRVLVAVPFWSPRGNLITFLSNRNVKTPDVTLWVAKPDGSDLRDLGIAGAWVCWSHDGGWLYYSVEENGVHKIRKVRVEGGSPVPVRDDNAVGCAAASDGFTLYYARILTQVTGAWDFEMRTARPENGPSQVIGKVSGSRIPVQAVNIQGYLSPDGKWLAMPLIDGSTTNLWALSTTGGGWRQLTNFGPRNVVIARRIGWASDGKSIYAALAEVDSDVVMVLGLNW